MDLGSLARNTLALAAGMLATRVDVDTGPPPPGLVRPLAEPSPPAAAAAEGPARPRPEDPVEIEVLVIRATNASDAVDPKLDRLVDHLRFTRYSGFTLLDRQRADVLRDEALHLEIERGRSVEVRLLGLHDGEAAVRMQMWSSIGRKQLDTTVRIHRGRSFMVAGPKVGEDVLILLVTVRW